MRKMTSRSSAPTEALGDFEMVEEGWWQFEHNERVVELMHHGILKQSMVDLKWPLERKQRIDEGGTTGDCLEPMLFRLHCKQEWARASLSHFRGISKSNVEVGRRAVVRCGGREGAGSAPRGERG